MESIIVSILVIATIAGMKHMTQNNVGKTGRQALFHLHVQIYSPSQREIRTGSQGRNLEAVAKAEAIENCCLVAYSSWLGQPGFL